MRPDEEMLAVRAAELYYEGGKSQEEIAALLGVNRWKVGRALVAAREHGIVRIEITHPRARRPQLEQALIDEYGLKDAVVVAAPPDDAAVLDRVAVAAADHLQALGPALHRLGVSWGRTLQQVAAALPAAWAHGVDVVQINGGVVVNRREGMASETATIIAQKSQGSVTLLPGPAILERVSTRQAIEDDRLVSGILDDARGAGALLFSAGSIGASSVLVESGYLTAGAMAGLAAAGAVGDVLGRFIDGDGRIVDQDLDERTLGLTLQDLRNADRAIAVIAGSAKHDVCRAVVASGYCSDLVTDEATARILVKEGR